MVSLCTLFMSATGGTIGSQGLGEIQSISTTTDVTESKVDQPQPRTIGQTIAVNSPMSDSTERNKARVKELLETRRRAAMKANIAELMTVRARNTGVTEKRVDSVGDRILSVEEPERTIGQTTAVMSRLRKGSTEIDIIRQRELERIQQRRALKAKINEMLTEGPRNTEVTEKRVDNVGNKTLEPQPGLSPIVSPTLNNGDVYGMATNALPVASEMSSEVSRVDTATKVIEQPHIGESETVSSSVTRTTTISDKVITPGSNVKPKSVPDSNINNPGVRQRLSQAAFGWYKRAASAIGSFST